MYRQIIKEVFSDILTTDPGTVIQTIFTISIMVGYIPIAYWFSDGFPFHFYLMVAIVLIPSAFMLDKEFAKLLPKDRSALPNRWRLEFVGPRVLASFAIAMILIIEAYGLFIFVYSVMPDVFHMQKTQAIDDAVLRATIYSALGVPGLLFYWKILLKKSEISRRALFTKKYRSS